MMTNVGDTNTEMIKTWDVVGRGKVTRMMTVMLLCFTIGSH